MPDDFKGIRDGLMEVASTGPMGVAKRMGDAGEVIMDKYRKAKDFVSQYLPEDRPAAPSRKRGDVKLPRQRKFGPPKPSDRKANR
jgi:hypothetical protein